VPTPAIDADPGILTDYSGLLINVGAPYQCMDGALSAIRYAREHGLPLLGTCSGFQHILVEFARNVLGIRDADHPGLNPDGTEFVLAPLSCGLTGQDRPVHIEPGTQVGDLYQTSETIEPFYCSYGLNVQYRDAFEQAGLRFSGRDADGVVRVLELPGHPPVRRAIMGYHQEVAMTDVLIRDVPDEVLAAVDARAGRLGLSRSEYVRRRLAQDAAAPDATVTAADLARFGEVFADLADRDVMDQAWR